MELLNRLSRLTCAALGALAVAAKPAPPITVAEVGSPAPAGSVGSALIRAPDGVVWLSWVQPGADRENLLRLARFDPATTAWSRGTTIRRGPDVTTSAMDFPQVAVDGRGQLLALWTDGHGGAAYAVSRDAARTWDVSKSWVHEAGGVEKFAFHLLADGRILAVWLDARGHPGGAGMQRLYGRILPADLSGLAEAPDILLDPAVCDCCQTAVAAFPDGGALVAYRGRTADEVRDIRTVRLHGGAWEEPRPLNHDDWHIAACPMNGPRVMTDGGRVAVGWFTAAGDDPRVLATYSPDAGARFLAPLRVDAGHPVGHVETVLLHDGAILIVWVEADGSLWLRRITPDFSLTNPVRLAGAGEAATKGIPRAALWRDYAGGRSSAEVLVAFTRAGARPGIATLRVTVPEGELLEAERDCDCAPTAEQLQGYPVRGTIAAPPHASGTVRVDLAETPGLFAAGPRELRLATGTPATLAPGREFLGRVRERDGAWWLYDLRLLAEPAK